MQTLYFAALVASALAQPLLSSSQVQTQELMVELTPRAKTTDLASVRVVAIADDTEEALIPTFRSGRQVHFDLPEGRDWRITCENNDLWCPDLEVVSSEMTDMQLPVTKRTLLRGFLRTESTTLPSFFKLQGWEIGADSAGALSFQVSVQIKNGHFEIPGPAIPLDLRLAAGGFSPTYLWDLDLGTDGKAGSRGVHDLGPIELRPGNSLCGFVLDKASGRPLEAANVELRVPRPIVGSRARSVERLRRMAWTTRTNIRGFFQLVGPPSGTYRLEVQSADPEYQLLVVESVGIVAESETCLEDLEVQRAFEVGFTVEPSRAPGGDPWQVRLTPKDSRGSVEPGEAVALDPTGRIGFQVSPGDYELEIFARNIRATALRRSFQLDNPDEFALILSFVQVEGSIHLGDDPLVAQIHLMGRDGDRTTLESDGEGFFGGWIRDPGMQSLVAEVNVAYPRFSRWLELDMVPKEGGILEFELRFEDRTITGSVQAQDGTPIRKARVTAVPIDSRMAIRSITDVDGRFKLTGLEDRPYLITAKAGGFGASEAIRVDPWGNETGPELSLVLHQGRRLQGRILSAESIPVPAARLTLLVPGAFRRIKATSTDVNGNFELRIPEGTRRAVAQVFAPSQMSWSACVEIPNGEESLVLHLPTMPSGEALLHLASAPSAFTAQTVLVTSEGGFLPLSSLANFGHMSHPATEDGPTKLGSREMGRSLKISSLAPGLYGAIQTAVGPLDLAAQSCAGALTVTDWQHLLPGSEITLSAGLNE